jgi:hypothetical protein
VENKSEHVVPVGTTVIVPLAFGNTTVASVHKIDLRKDCPYYLLGPTLGAWAKRREFIPEPFEEERS